MKKLLPPAITLVVAAGVALILHVFFGLPLVAGILLVLVGLLVNGLVAKVEDDLPGGFNNSDGSATPAYVSKLRGVTVAVVAVALLLTLLIVVISRWPS